MLSSSRPAPNLAVRHEESHSRNRSLKVDPLRVQRVSSRTVVCPDAVSSAKAAPSPLERKSHPPPAGSCPCGPGAGGAALLAAPFVASAGTSSGRPHAASSSSEAAAIGLERRISGSKLRRIQGRRASPRARPRLLNSVGPLRLPWSPCPLQRASEAGAATVITVKLAGENDRLCRCFGIHRARWTNIPLSRLAPGVVHRTTYG